MPEFCVALLRGARAGGTGGGQGVGVDGEVGHCVRGGDGGDTPAHLPLVMNVCVELRSRIFVWCLGVTPWATFVTILSHVNHAWLSANAPSHIYHVVVP